MTEGSREIVAKKVFSSLVYTFEEKKQLLQHLLDGGEPDIVDADMDNAMLFVGFAPDPSVNLTSSATIIVSPRHESLTLDKQLNHIEIYRKLNEFNKLARGSCVQALVLYKTPWVEEWAEIVWYSFFRDEVSIKFSDGGYKIIPRKELCSNGLTRPEHSEASSTERGRDESVHIQEYSPCSA